MQQAVRHTRTTTALLILAFLWNGFAHAAKPSHKFPLLLAASSPAQATAANREPPEIGPPQTGPSQPLGARERMRFAHTVLLAQTGNDPHFLISETDTYNTVLNALNQWGRYRIVRDASQADLVLQLHGAAIASVTAATPGDPGGSVAYSSVLHLTVADPHTLAPVWEVSVPVGVALRSSARDRNIAAAGENAVSQLKLLAGETLSRQEQAQLKQASSHHAGRDLLLVGAGVAVTLGIFFIARHAVQNNQATFCQQHGISPCPGA